MEAPADGLPRDYRIVYDEMTSYLWRSASGDGTGDIALRDDALAL